MCSLEEFEELIPQLFFRTAGKNTWDLLLPLQPGFPIPYGEESRVSQGAIKYQKSLTIAMDERVCTSGLVRRSDKVCSLTFSPTDREKRIFSKSYIAPDGTVKRGKLLERMLQCISSQTSSRNTDTLDDLYTGLPGGKLELMTSLSSFGKPKLLIYNKEHTEAAYAAGLEAHPTYNHCAWQLDPRQRNYDALVAADNLQPDPYKLISAGSNMYLSVWVGGFVLKESAFYTTTEVAQVMLAPTPSVEIVQENIEHLALSS